MMAQRLACILAGVFAVIGWTAVADAQPAYPAGATDPAMGPGPAMGAGSGGISPEYPVQLAGGGSAMYFDPAIRYASCDACDAHGNPIGNCPPGGGYGAGAAPWGGQAGFEQCGPHYFDFSAEFLYWKRDRIAEPPYAISSLDRLIDGGNVVLTTASGDLDYEPGFRLIGRYDISPTGVVEASYYGTYEWETSASVNGDGNLYSFFSDFGANALVGDVDLADVHAFRFGSELHNAEISFRQYWVGHHPAITGTWLLGARYTRLTEDFLFSARTNGPPATFLDYDVDTENDLVGFQAGLESQICLRQGFRMYMEGKAGIYNNRAKQRTRIDSTQIAPSSIGTAEGNNVAFIGEGRIGFIADLLPSWSVKIGYEALWLNSVALAANQMQVNSDPTVVFSGNPAIAVELADQGRAFYHGLNAGVEYIW